MVESSPATKPDGSLAGDTASMHSFAWAGGAGGGKQREGLGVGDLREALSVSPPLFAGAPFLSADRSPAPLL
jgi:hypothetical protein